MYKRQVEGGVFAKALGLQSTDMTIEEYEKGIRITTKGVGHGFGMSLTSVSYTHLDVYKRQPYTHLTLIQQDTKVKIS